MNGGESASDDCRNDDDVDSAGVITCVVAEEVWGIKSCH